MDEGRLNAEGAKQFRGLGSGRAVGAIHQNAQLAQIGRYARRQRFDVGMAQVGFAGKRWLGNLERGVVGGSRILQQRENFFFDGEFALVGEFEAVAGENFDAVIGPGIVRRGNHHAGGQRSRAREVGDAGSGDDAGTVDVDANGGETFGDAVGDPRAGFARVLANHGLGACAWRASGHGQGRGQSDKCFAW